MVLRGRPKATPYLLRQQGKPSEGRYGPQGPLRTRRNQPLPKASSDFLRHAALLRSRSSSLLNARLCSEPTVLHDEPLYKPGKSEVAAL